MRSKKTWKAECGTWTPVHHHYHGKNCFKCILNAFISFDFLFACICCWLETGSIDHRNNVCAHQCFQLIECARRSIVMIGCVQLLLTSHFLLCAVRLSSVRRFGFMFFGTDRIFPFFDFGLTYKRIVQLSSASNATKIPTKTLREAC